MKAVIFAGGIGTRLWPLSRENSPKQFEKIFGDESTLQAAVGRLLTEFNYKDIYISTGEQYLDTVLKQLPDIPEKNVVGEPEMRDVGPAVGLMAAILAQKHAEEPFAILWSDHLVKKVELFNKILKTAGEVIEEDKERIIFIGQKPRFASQNLGWIECGKAARQVNGFELRSFHSLKYRPEKQLAEEFHNSGKHLWNPGYFVTSPAFILDRYAKFAPHMHRILAEIADEWGKPDFKDILHRLYPKLEKTSFDNLILEKLDPDAAYVIEADIGWSDVGAWEALKEALQDNPTDNVTKGNVMLTDCEDSLVYNYADQAIAAIDLKGMLVVNTDDALLVCAKDSVPKIKKFVKSLPGTENEDLA